jgi:hypothetical protein
MVSFLKGAEHEEYHDREASSTPFSAAMEDPQWRVLKHGDEFAVGE